jgi:hypothetical protein
MAWRLCLDLVLSYRILECTARGVWAPALKVALNVRNNQKEIEQEGEGKD